MPSSPRSSHHLIRTTLVSATLAALCHGQDAQGPHPRNATSMQTPGTGDLNTTAFTFTAIPEDAVNNGGDKAFNIINPQYQDGTFNQHGIAIIAQDTTHGHWEYTTNWSGNTGWTSVGAVSATNALLLSLTSTFYTTASDVGLRFVPNANFDQTAANSLSFIAWDETQLTANTYADTTQYPVFGSAIGQGSIAVTPVNDAPVLDVSGSPYLDAATYTGAPSGSGTRIDVLLSRGANGTISDVDANALTGIAVVGADTTYGSWQYAFDGVSWSSLPAVSATNAFLMNVSLGPYASGTDVRLRFVPNAGFTGTISNAISFRGWDQTNFVNAGSTIDPTSGIGGTGSFSVSVETASIFVNGSTSVVASVVFPEPPVSGPGDTVYGAICPGTPEGLDSLLAAMNGKDPREARAFSWDGVTQKFVELPGKPTVGLHSDTGFFLATRQALPIDFAGSLSAIPCVLTLQPGWNLVGVPALDDAGTTVLSHPWDDFQLVDDTATAVTAIGAFTDVLGTPSSNDLHTTRPWYWDGSSYQQVTTLETGKAYWIKNNSSLVYTLERMATAQNPNPRIAQAAGANAPRGTITDRGAPPRPPTAASTAESGRGCGVGTGLGVLVLSMAGLLRRRRE